MNKRTEKLQERKIIGMLFSILLPSRAYATNAKTEKSVMQDFVSIIQ